MGTPAIIMIVLLLASTLASLVPAAPLPAAHSLIPPAHSNVTTIRDYLTRTWHETLLHFTLPSRRCGGRRKCRGGNSPPPPPPPPPPPSRIVQNLVLNRVNTSHYVGMYKLVVEAGWGISIGIYDKTTRQGWKPGVSATSSASKICDANLCGIKVRFSATIPYYLGHQAESLSASQFCSGVASAKTAMAYSQQQQGFLGVPNATDVTVLTTDIHEGEHEVEWSKIIIAGAFGLLLCCGLIAILGAACGGGR